MGFAARQHKCIASIFAAMVVVAVCAEDAPRRAGDSSRRGEAIVFSGTVTDSTSTNLTLNNSKAGLKSLEDDIKKPFDLFDRGNSLTDFRPLPVVRPPPMIEKTKRAQELLQRKEDAFFDIGNEEDKAKADDPYSIDPEKRKSKSPLERYYERLDRERGGVTNQLKGREMFGDKKQKDDEQDVLSAFFGNDRAGDDPQIAARTGRRMSNNPAAGSLFSTETVKPRTVEDLLGGSMTPLVTEQDKARESHLDAFKKLMGVESFTPPNPQTSSSLLPITKSAPPPAPGSQARPATTYSVSPPASYLQGITSPSTPSPGLSGNSTKSYGSWQDAQAYGNTPSLMPTPFQQPKPKAPPPSFSLPQRKF